MFQCFGSRLFWLEEQPVLRYRTQNWRLENLICNTWKWCLVNWRTVNRAWPTEIPILTARLIKHFLCPRHFHTVTASYFNAASRSQTNSEMRILNYSRSHLHDNIHSHLPKLVWHTITLFGTLLLSYRCDASGVSLLGSIYASQWLLRHYSTLLLSYRCDAPGVSLLGSIYASQ
jgi:hypothetical protein